MGRAAVIHYPFTNTYIPSPASLRDILHLLADGGMMPNITRQQADFGQTLSKAINTVQMVNGRYSRRRSGCSTIRNFRLFHESCFSFCAGHGASHFSLPPELFDPY